MVTNMVKSEVMVEEEIMVIKGIVGRALGSQA